MSQTPGIKKFFSNLVKSNKTESYLNFFSINSYVAKIFIASFL